MFCVEDDTTYSSNFIIHRISNMISVKNKKETFCLVIQNCDQFLFICTTNVQYVWGEQILKNDPQIKLSQTNAFSFFSRNTLPSVEGIFFNGIVKIHISTLDLNDHCLFYNIHTTIEYRPSFFDLEMVPFCRTFQALSDELVFKVVGRCFSKQW